MRLGIDPKVDIVFKRLFGSEDNAGLLIALLHAILTPVRRITGIEIAQSESEKGTKDEKQVIGDIRSRDQGKRHFHLEMQMQAPWSFTKRMLFYWAKFHSQQLREGDDYEVLCLSYFICFTNQDVFADLDDSHLTFRLLEVKHGLPFCEDIEIHLIQLPKFTKTAEQLSSDLDRWCYFLRHGEDLDLDNLPPALDVPFIRRAMEVLTVFTQDERDLYEARLKAQRDQRSLLKEARDEGFEKGRKEGLVAQVHLCQELLKQIQTPEADLLKLSLDELNALLAGLRKQILPST
jgi:predicted transposase/invertase (TIGR01784 family)